MKTRKIFWGLLLIGGSVLLLLHALGLGEQYELFRYASSVFLLAIAAVNIYRLRFLFFLLPAALTVYLWREPLGIASVNFWLLLAAAAVLGIGLSVIFHKKSRFISRGKSASCCGGHSEKSEEVLSQDERVDIDGSMGEFSKFIHAANLRQVRISCSLSTIKDYFDQCQANPEGLEVLLKVNLSGVELHMPRSWQIDNQLAVNLGEVNGPMRGEGEGGVKVRLIGQVNLAEVKIVRI